METGLHLRAALNPSIVMDQRIKNPAVKFFACCLVLASWFVSPGKACAQSEDVMWLVPHFHHDVTYKMDQEVMDCLASIMTHVLVGNWRTDPRFTFVIDQVRPVRAYMDVYPHETADLHKALGSVRAEVPGAMYVQPDLELAMGESYVRQIRLGKRFFKETFGIEPVGCWNIDSFGHSIQLPQILSKSGIRHMAFARNETRPWIHPDFFWESPDGSRVLTHWMCIDVAELVRQYFSGALLGISRCMQWEFDKVKVLYDKAREKPRVGGNILVPCGTDMVYLGNALTDLVDEWNRHPPEGYPVKLRMATPSEFFHAVGSHADALPVYDMDFQTTWKGYYVSRINYKQKMRQAENGLLTWEKAATLAHSEGERYPAQGIEAAWEDVLEAQFHDLLPGSTVDPAILHYLQRIDGAVSEGREGAEKALEYLAGLVDTRAGPATDEVFILFNPVSWERREPVTLELDLGEPGFPPRLLDASGQEIPYQIPVGAAEEKGSTAVTLAVDLPPFGITCIFVDRTSPPAQDPHEVPNSGPVMETAHYRMVLNGQGTVEILEDRQEGVPLLKLGGLANTIHVEDDLGTVYRLRHEDAGSRVASTEDSEYGFDLAFHSGPVLLRATATGPFFDSTLTREVRVYRASRRIDFITTLDWQGEQKKVIARFPFAGDSEGITTSIPYGFQARPDGDIVSGYAATLWADYGHQDRGVTLATLGLPYFSSLKGDVSLMLMRATARFTRDDDVPLAQMHGRQRFVYSILPHQGTWQESGTHRLGWELNTPPIFVSTGNHAGRIPPVFSWMSTSANLVAPAVEVRDGAVWLRVLEALGQEGTGGVLLNGGLRPGEVRLTDFTGKRSGPAPLRVQHGRFTHIFKQQEIAAFEIRTDPETTGTKGGTTGCQCRSVETGGRDDLLLLFAMVLLFSVFRGVMRILLQRHLH